jgi:hypothetical protein
MPGQAALAAVATLLSFAPQGNRIDFRMDRGSAEMTWVAPGAFRFRRVLEGSLPAVQSRPAERVEIETDDMPGAVRMRSKRIEVSIQKRGLLVSVRRLDGTPLMSDVSEPRAQDGAIGWERSMPAGVRYYGLKPRPDLSYDWRGKADETATPFLVSTAGYGELHLGGPYRFDFTGAGQYRIEGPLVDYFFYYGSRPKDIFEERNQTRDAEGPLAAGAISSGAAGERGTWESLGQDLLRLTHSAMSGILSGIFDLDRYAQAPPELLARARQFGSLAPGIIAGTAGLSDFRKQLGTFFASYEPEKRDKGYPVWHPLPFQFPDDAECARHADEFLLGDEMLIAPIYDPKDARAVYLPQGIWTNLETNEALQGRRTVTVQTKALPVFARNGTILPLDSEGGTGLHYFPALAAEFFILERAAGAWTQVHASPAADIFRLEIDAKAARDYQWVVHHVERPAQVGFEETKYAEVPALNELRDRTWFYEAGRKNLHIRVHVNAGEDSVIHVTRSKSHLSPATRFLRL